MKFEKPQKQRLLEKTLRLMAMIVLKKYRPEIVAITGSLGKTSAKDAVFSVLENRSRVRRSEKNYNNEIGIPLTIIGAQSAGASFFGWLGISFKWLGTVLFPLEYPEILILEMGADRPGDIDYYIKGFVQPEVSILTDISGSHLEYFKNIDQLAREKFKIISALPERGTAILNIDSEPIAKFAKELLAAKKDIKIVTYGFSEEADVRATDVTLSYANDTDAPHFPEVTRIKGLSFKLNFKGSSIPIRLGSILGKHNIYAALAATAAGIEKGLNLVEIGSSLERFKLPKGRMTLIPGIKESSIIDDSYNASPKSTLAALDVLREIRARRKILVFGDMLELGPDEESGHWEVAKKFLDIKGDIFIGVGRRTQFAIEELKKRNTAPERIFHFGSPMDAGKKLKEILEEGDLALIKGSQGMRMEKVVNEAMASPQHASELLCRQDPEWLAKPWKEV